MILLSSKRGKKEKRRTLRSLQIGNSLIEYPLNASKFFYLHCHFINGVVCPTCHVWQLRHPGPCLHRIWCVKVNCDIKQALVQICISGFIWRTCVSQHRQSKLMTQLKKMQMITIKGRLIADMGEGSMLLGFELTFKMPTACISRCK